MCRSASTSRFQWSFPPHSTADVVCGDDSCRPGLAPVDALAKAGGAFVALKENIRVEGKRDIQTKVMTTLFALFAEVERDLISERTREGLAKARASGRKLGRPKGVAGRFTARRQGG